MDELLDVFGWLRLLLLGANRWMLSGVSEFEDRKAILSLESQPLHNELLIGWWQLD